MENKMEYTTPEQFAEEHDYVYKPRYTFFLYPHPAQRICVEVEQQIIDERGYLHIWRSDKLAEAGIYEADKDAEQFANDFVERFCDHLSLHQLQYLIPAIQKSYDDWEARRQLSLVQINNKRS